MAANPALVQTVAGGLVPAPFPGELFVLRRDGMQCKLEGVQTRTKGWMAKGTVFLSNVRLVFVAQEADPSGLVAYDFPLVYIKDDNLNQPIFTCNNLSGRVWPAVPGGGPAGSLPPQDFNFYFLHGGIGTFYPLYYTLTQRAKAAFASQQQVQMQQLQYLQQQQVQMQVQQVQQQAQYGVAPSAQELNPPEYVQGLVAQAFVDPADPTTIYLSQPVGKEAQLPTAPRYAANYGQEEKYEPMAPGH